MWGWLFYDRTSNAGRNKWRLLRGGEGQVVCPVFSHKPEFRISWEMLQRLIIAPAEEECFGRIINELLPNLLPGYQPKHGIDLDLFLIVDAKPPPAFCIEILPRQVPDQMVTEFGSVINFKKVPLAITSKSGLMDFLNDVVVGGLVRAGYSHQEILKLVGRFGKDGCWPVRSLDSLRLLVKAAASSLVELFDRGSAALVEAGFTQDWSRQERRAFLRRSRGGS